MCVHKFVRDVYAVSSIVLLQLHLFLVLEGDNEMVREDWEQLMRWTVTEKPLDGVRIEKHHAGVLGQRQHIHALIQSSSQTKCVYLYIQVENFQALDMECVLLRL